LRSPGTPDQALEQSARVHFWGFGTPLAEAGGIAVRARF
jgi:hypothetical protein